MDDTLEKAEVLRIIGRNIKRARLLRGMTQEALSDKLNKSTNFISLVERGESGVSISTLVDICNVLQVDSSIIFEGLISIVKPTDTEHIAQSISIFDNEDKAIVTDLIEYIMNSKN
jgi:transcriptional regulator with XRE-family HTH domain